MAGVRITLVSFKENTPEIVDTTTFASPTAAVAGIATGFLIVTPDGGHSTQTAIAAAQIKQITQK